MKSERVLKNKNLHSMTIILFFCNILAPLALGRPLDSRPCHAFQPRPTILCRSNTSIRRNFPWKKYTKKMFEIHGVIVYLFYLFPLSLQKKIKSSKFLWKFCQSIITDFSDHNRFIETSSMDNCTNKCSYQNILKW